MPIERRCFANDQNSRRKSLEISGISASVADNGLGSKVLGILETFNVPIDPSLVEDYHSLPTKGSPKKVIIKSNRHKDIRRSC